MLEAGASGQNRIGTHALRSHRRSLIRFRCSNSCFLLETGIAGHERLSLAKWHPEAEKKLRKRAVFRHRWQAWKVVRSIAAVRQRPMTPRNWRYSFAFFESCYRTPRFNTSSQPNQQTLNTSLPNSKLSLFTSLVVSRKTKQHGALVITQCVLCMRKVCRACMRRVCMTFLHSLSFDISIKNSAQRWSSDFQGLFHVKIRKMAQGSNDLSTLPLKPYRERVSLVLLWSLKPKRTNKELSRQRLRSTMLWKKTLEKSRLEPTAPHKKRTKSGPSLQPPSQMASRSTCQRPSANHKHFPGTWSPLLNGKTWFARPGAAGLLFQLTLCRHFSLQKKSKRCHNWCAQSLVR